MGTFFLQAVRKPYHQGAVDALNELEKLKCEDVEVAEAAFLRLKGRMEDFLRRYLRHWLSAAEDREDIVAVALMKIWEHRLRFELRTEGAWMGYMATIARRCALDFLRRPSTVSLEQDMATLDPLPIDTMLIKRAERDRVYEAADELWLGRERGLDDRSLNRRVLAAQLFYLERQPWREVAELVGLGPEDRPTLDGWLSDVGVAMVMAYRELYWTDEQLGAFLNAGWTDEERRVIHLKHNLGYREDRIYRECSSLTKEEIDAILQAYVARYPFAKIARVLQEAFRHSEAFQEAVCNPGLWKRLTFQYHAKGNLPQKQIVARIRPASDVIGYRFNDGIVNVWISSGRLVEQLQRYLAGEMQ